MRTGESEGGEPGMSQTSGQSPGAGGATSASNPKRGSERALVFGKEAHGEQKRDDNGVERLRGTGRQSHPS